MTQYLVRRILWGILVLFAVSIITFSLMHIAPGGPWDRDSSNKPLPQRTIERLNAQFHLDLPWYQQYALYMWGAVRGDLGPSYQKPGQNVSDLLRDRLPYSLKLGVGAIILATLVGFPLGVIAAVKRNSWADYTALFFATIGTAVPNFVIGIYLIIIFAVGLHLFPVAATNWDDPRAWVLPIVTLALVPMAYIARLVRSSLIETLGQDYVRTARAKGLAPNKVVLKHALRNAMIPVWTVLGPITAGLVTGSFIVETLYSVPGIGRFFVDAISRRDYSMIMGTTLVYALTIALANLFIDLTYGIWDPRLKVGE